MISALLMVLLLGIIQLALMIHVRNTLIDAASTGARFGVLDDRTPDDGVARTRALIASSIADRYAQDVQYAYVHAPEGRLLRITITTQVPVLGILPGTGQLQIRGSAYDFH